MYLYFIKTTTLVTLPLLCNIVRRTVYAASRLWKVLITSDWSKVQPPLHPFTRGCPHTFVMLQGVVARQFCRFLTFVTCSAVSIHLKNSRQIVSLQLFFKQLSQKSKDYIDSNFFSFSVKIYLITQFSCKYCFVYTKSLI